MKQKSIVSRMKDFCKRLSFVFLFVCCWFVFDSFTVKGAPTISIPNNCAINTKPTNSSLPDCFDYENGLVFYVGFDMWGISSVEYSFDNSKFTSLDTVPYLTDSEEKIVCGYDFVECTDVIHKYTVAKSSLPTSGTSFNFYVKAKNTALFSNSSSKNVTGLLLDNDSPTITSIKASGGSNNYAVKDSVLTFEINFNEPVKIKSSTSNVQLKFKIGDATKNATCKFSSSVNNVIKCNYTVVAKDNGTISYVEIVNESYIVDNYTNAVLTDKNTSSGSAVVITSSITVDAVAPTVASVVTADEVFKSYKENDKVTVEVKFSEKMIYIDKDVPALNVKFGTGETKSCELNSGANESGDKGTFKIIYNCLVSSTDQGALKFVSLSYSGSSKYLTDLAGNKVDLTFSEKEFSNSYADNEKPAINPLTITNTGCKQSSSYYCSANSKITVSFTLNMSINDSSSVKNIKFYFGGKVMAKNVSISYDSTTKKYSAEYTVSSSDNGALSVKYSFVLVGENGNKTTIAEVEKTYSNYYAENDKPSVSSLEIYVNSQKFTSADKTIYVTENDKIEFKVFILDSSKISFVNNSLLDLVDANEASVCGNMYNCLRSLSGGATTKAITLTVTVKTNNKSEVKLKVGKNAITDVVNNNMTADYFSDLYVIDSKLPEYDVSIFYPEYKGYLNDQKKFVITSGNVIDFSVTSSDKDLVNYCVYLNNTSECSSEKYKTLVLGERYSYQFETSSNKEYSFYIMVVDSAGNYASKGFSFILNNLFSYSNGSGTVNKSHSITFDTSFLDNGDTFKYAWFKEGAIVNFGSASVSAKDTNNSFTVPGVSTYNGNYRVCVLDVSSSGILCSEYVTFDTKIDSFSVDVLTGWVNGAFNASITFNDISAIKCIVISRGQSDIDCSSKGDNIDVYFTSEISSPISYDIQENGVYYFYIEDRIGNKDKITKNVSNIDVDGILIEIFNGNSSGYDSNLDIENYKTSHKFKLTFDRNSDEGSPVEQYKYFFNSGEYDIKDEDNFNYYYDKQTVNRGSGNDKLAMISSPNNKSGSYRLYIMAVDIAGNVSFEVLDNIKVDVDGPVITMYDLNGNVTNGGSTSYVSKIDGKFEILEINSGLDLNNISYTWVDSSNNVVFYKEYHSCTFDYNKCEIKGSDIELSRDVFSYTTNYKLIIKAKDNAGNEGVFTTYSYKIDTTPPSITTSIQNKWYTTNSFSFVVETGGNVGTLSTIGYCLNDCLNDKEYDLSKFNSLDVNNPTVENKTIVLDLMQGVNVLYIYASDVFGNYSYSVNDIKYDTELPTVVVNNLSNGVVDLNLKEKTYIDFTVSDASSGVKKYCVYLKEAEIKCESVNLSSKNVVLDIEKNGDYSIVVLDNTGLEYNHNVKVIGIDKDPISFDLKSSVADGSYTNKNPLISIINMNKGGVSDVASNVMKIEYVSSETYNSDYSGLFTGSTVLYQKGVNNSLITSFEVSENKYYYVRIQDTAGNVSFDYIRIKCIDKVAPFMNHDLLEGADRIYLTTEDGSNIVKIGKEYKYSNKTLQIVFKKSSFKDLYNGYNKDLIVKVCFDEGNGCNYNSYNASSIVDDLYLTNNNSVTVSANYHFSGIVRYYLVDGAGNESEKYEIKVTYQDGVSDVVVELKDHKGNYIVEDKKYNSVVASFNMITGADTEIRYAIVSSKINLYYEFDNKNISNAQFLSNYGFVMVNDKTINITKNSVDDNYYAWVYASDAYGNYKLFNVGVLIRLDTITPSFDEIEYEINKVASTEYLLVLLDNKGYGMSISVGSNDNFEEVIFEDYKCSFTTSGISVYLKLIDSAGNESEIKHINLNEISSTPYGRVYQNGNDRIATVVVYNIGTNNLTFRYVVDQLKSNNAVYTESYINDLPTCRGNEMGCVRTAKSGENGVYSVSVEADMKVVFYINVGDTLIHDKNGNMLIVDLIRDDVKPVVSFSNSNPTLISTYRGINTYSLSVEEKNISKYNDIRYVLTSDSVVSAFNAYYNNCVNSNSCVRGVYDLDDSLTGTILVDSNLGAFSKLQTGVYYIHTYVEDAFGNSVIGRSNSIYVDNDNPIVSHASSSGEYVKIVNEVFVSQTTSLKFTDNKGIHYFDILNGRGDVVTTCNVLDSSNNKNCDNNSYSQVGNAIYYKLDTGNYMVVVYDVVGNVNVVSINIDSAAPVIKLYKNISGNYVEQPNVLKTYNSLTDLYLKIIDDNFSYLTVDLLNVITGTSVLDAVRYSYNSDLGKCLYDSSKCEYGSELSDIVVASSQYTNIIFKVYDKANRLSSLEVKYDDIIPIIWTKDVGESVRINGVFYNIEEEMTINFDIGVDKNLTLDVLLNNLIINVDGFSYSSVKNKELFKVNVYKKNDGVYDTLFDLELFEHIGNYKVMIDYSDDAGNKALTKVVYINVLDNIAPSFDLSGKINFAELNREVKVNPIIARDNYGFDGSLVKEKYLYFEDATSYTVNGVTCSNCVVKVSDGVYKFVKKGNYVFNFSISDIGSNSASITYNLSVSDTEGPVISTGESASRVVEIGERNGDNSINVQNVIVNYPTSYDEGDIESKVVSYVGLFSLNNMKEKYKISDDVYLVSDDGSKVVYKFTVIGVYYLRFKSSDKNGNVSTIDFEVRVEDNIKPVISGIKDGDAVEVFIDEEGNTSVDQAVLNIGITVKDNYDENVKFNYVVNNNSLMLSVKDSSDNEAVINLVIKYIDEIVPVVGQLNVVSSSNLDEIPFSIVGGSDNSNNWWHEYSVDSVNWIKYEKDSKLMIGKGVSKKIDLCIRANDSINISAKVCREIIVDTSSPIIEGVSNGEVIKSFTLGVQDDNLTNVVLEKDGFASTIAISSLPMLIDDEGVYRVIAKDSFGNVTTINFAVRNGVYVGIVNDINAKEYSITSVEFDKNMLIKLDVNYDEKGNTVVTTNLKNVNVPANSTVYILGVVPNTDATFVMFTANGSSLGKYDEGLVLVDNGISFKEGVANEDCLVKIGDSYYAYLGIKEIETDDTTIQVNGDKNSGGNRDLLNKVLIGLGAVVVLFIGYQLIRLKKRVKAA